MNLGVIIAALTIIAVVMLTLFYIYKFKLRRQEIENKMEDINELSIKLTDIVNQKQDSDTRLHKYIETLFRNQWQTINALCNRYFEAPKNELTKTLVFSEFKDQLSKLTDRKNIKKIEDGENLFMDNMLTKIREEFLKVSDPDIEFLALVLAGFKAKTVCLFTGISYKNFYSKKTRMINKIIKEASPELGSLVSKYAQLRD